MQTLKKSLRTTRQHLKRVARALPDQDAYAAVYSILSDLSRIIGMGLKDLTAANKEAKKLLKKQPNQSANRAKKWCRKP